MGSDGKVDVYRFRACFYDAPPVPFVFNARTEDGRREFSHFETEDGTVVFRPRSRRDWDVIDGIKEVDG